ncbi:helix-turn-helix domain-containing protein [Saccharopolyspora sp. TS4A08]|uniref:Helix-turn-helix domain-containing protein n=1 Tax=Saccharopolyspora ipomoeae TaxID=3042027 RepID=A0ABT6PVA2_9PSEU|nr:helix-turn-helix domain-containing protein [Saccharopolyspora sp. TS4A08]MDI2031792.1 helix-turn-helix domain-containing protein [Saccharopolyspora sp. TS4A08]
MGTGMEHADQDVVDRWAAAVAAELNRRLTTETLAIKKVLEASITELRGDARLLELLGASIEGNLDTILHTLQHNIAAEHLEAPAAAMEYARRLAQHGVPVNALVRAYRLGQRTLLDIALSEVEVTNLDANLRLSVAHRIVSVVSDYIDWISQQVVDVYEHERERWLATRSSLRTVRVRELLREEDAPAPETEADIGYAMGQQHLAVILWLPDTGKERIADLEQAAHAIAHCAGARRSPLFVAFDRVSGWAWIPLGGRSTIDRSQIRSCVAERADSLSVAVGTPAHGHSGFRESHQRAQLAHDIALLSDAADRRITFYDEPGLPTIALLSKNIEETKRWVAEILGPLAANTDSAQRLRCTLREFLSRGSSHKAAAEVLNLHYNTVKYRIKKAEDERRRPIGTDRLDVELALQACQWLGKSVLMTEQD